MPSVAAGGQHLDAVDPIGAALVLQRRGAAVSGDLLLQQVGEVAGVDDEPQIAQLSVGIQHRVDHVGQLVCVAAQPRTSPSQPLGLCRCPWVRWRYQGRLGTSARSRRDGPGQLSSDPLHANRILC